MNQGIFSIILIGIVALIAGLIFVYFKATDEEQFQQMDRIEAKINIIITTTNRIDKRLLIEGCKFK